MNGDRAAGLTLPAADMRRIGYAVIDDLVAHFTTVAAKPVTRMGARADLEAALREPLPEEGMSADDAFAILHTHVWSNIMHLDHPRFFGFVPSPSNFMGAMAAALVAGYNPFAGTWLEGSGPAMIELVVIDWLRRLCGLPEGAGGHFVTGGSAANLTGLALARHVQLADDGRSAVLYCSDQTHVSVDRACWLLGFGREQVRRLPVDGACRLDLATLHAALAADRAAGRRPFCVVANAGTTNTGAVDPLPDLAALCRREGLWLHVDGAYGAAAVFSSQGRRALAGLEHADSLAIDPHKWLFQPYECGVVLVRDRALLGQTFAMHAAYLQDIGQSGGPVDFFEEGIQLTRSFRALMLWLTIKVFGAAAVRAAVDHGIGLAELAEAQLRRDPCWQVISPAHLAIVAFRYAPPGVDPARLDAVNQGIVRAAIDEGVFFLSSTELHGRVALRLCTINPRTTPDDVQLVIDRLARYGRQLLAAEEITP